MANLETLSIEINANASQASTTISQLAESLSSLAKKLGKSIGGLKLLNTELQNLRENGNVKLPNLSKAMSSNRTVRSVRTATQAVHEQAAATNEATEAVRRYHVQTEHLQFATTQENNRTPYPIRETGLISGGMFGMNSIPRSEMTVGEFSKLMERGRAYIPGMSQAGASSFVRNIMEMYGENANWQESAHTAFGNIADVSRINATTSAMTELRQETEATSNATENTVKNTKELAEATKQIGKASATVRQTHKATSGLFSQVGRIAKTMLIRTAIRSVMKMAREGFNNFYEYSKSVSNAYATAIDSMKASATTSGNQIGAALGTLLATIAPILNTIISIVTAAAEAITMLFSLLGGGSTYIRATNGLNSVGKAAGGAGSKVKELLASFDELNVIASESGGGGGGAGAGFGGMFEEAPIPQWMQEWKPLLEALLGAGLGALILPWLLDLIKKLFGGKDFWDMLKHYFKKDFPVDPTDYNFPDQPNYRPFPEQPHYQPFPVQPTYQPFPAAPDYGKAATDMSIFSGAAIAAAPAVTTIVTMLEKLKTGMDLIEVLKTLLTGLLAKALGSKIKIDVDRKAFDEFKKEFEDWKNKTQSKPIRIVPDTTELDRTSFELKRWLEEEGRKWIVIKVDAEELEDFSRDLLQWLSERSVKRIVVALEDYDRFKSRMDNINDWANRGVTKKINVAMDVVMFTIQAIVLDAWVSRKDTKHITVSMSMTDYALKKLAIDAWTGRKDTKNITVSMSMTDYALKKLAIDTWVSRKDTKNITVSMSITDYTLKKLAIDTWVGRADTKKINIDIATAYVVFLLYRGYIDGWVNATPTKYININITNAYGTFLTYANYVMQWVNTRVTKYVSIDIYASYILFLVYANLVTAWAGTSLTKYIYLNIYNWNSFWDNASSIQSWANTTITKYVNVVITGSVNLSKPTGLDWSLMNGLTWNGQNVLDLAIQNLGFAEGGFPTSGDLFIANEQGAEMIGSLNGRTAVANTDQIVSGIAQGVSEANSEQNALLRQQNELLRGILEKDASVRIGASAALGRVARQSLDMYGSLVGG